MNKPETLSAERGAGSVQRPCSAWVYSGPHYGRKHKVLGRRGSIVEVEYRGDRFAVPYCDLEYESPKSGLGAGDAQMQGRGRDTANHQTLSPNDPSSATAERKP